MEKHQVNTLTTRIISVCFIILALAVFKPFGLDALHWEVYAHLLAIWVLGLGVCFLTEAILKFIVRMPMSTQNGVGYIIRRNLWFQIINTPLEALMICLYRQYAINGNGEDNVISWGNYFETLLIIAFCSFVLGVFWRFKFRTMYLTEELEETKSLNEQLQKLQQEATQRAKEAELVAAKSSEPQPPTSIILKGTTNETVSLQIPHLLYIETVGNYVKVCHLREGKVVSSMLRATSKQMEDDLKAYPTIVRCHRAFLVNLQQVEQLISKPRVMKLVIKHSNESIPVSRSNMADVKNAIHQG